MPYGLYLSAAGANAQSHRLEVLSHNLANINTAGFKPHLSMLQSRHAEAIEQGEVLPGSGMVDDVGGGLRILPNHTDFSQGPIQQTGNRTDFAIHNEDGFFVVQRGDKQLLTRAGNFTIDRQGRLVTSHGDPVLSVDDDEIRIDPLQPFDVTDDGAIQQAGVRQELKLGRPPELGDLARVNDNLFEPLTGIENVPPEQRRIRSRSLETSAVQPTQAMMELIEASRVYEANVRMIQSQDNAMGQLISRVLAQG